MHFLYKAICTGAFALMLTACNNSSENTGAANSTGLTDSIAQPATGEGEDYFALNKFSLGSHADSLEQRYDWIKEMHEEMSSDTSLKEVKVMVTLYNRPGMLELNFKDKKLYSYYYILDSVQQDAGDSIYANLQQQLAQKHGSNFTEEAVNEGSHNRKSSFWRLGNNQVVLTYNVGSRVISWGRQQSPA